MTFITLRIGLPLSLLFFSLGVFASDKPYFSRLLAEINHNIEEDNLEENLSIIPRFVQDEDFKKLNCYQKGKIFHRIGVTYYLLDRESEAIACFQDSVLAVWQNCTDVPETEKATTIYNIGICYQYLGEIEQAKQYLDQALFIFENAPDYPPFELAKKFHGIANFYLDINDSFRAELYYQNALNIYRTIEGTELRRFEVLNNFLIMSVNFKKYKKAEAYFEEAMALYRNFPDAIDPYDLSMLYQNAGIAHFELGELEQALQKTQSGLALINASEYPVLYTNAVEKIAMINGESGKFAQAVEGLNTVVRIRSEHLSNLESYQHLAYAFENLFEIYRKQGELDQADNFLKKAIDMLMISAIYDTDGLPVVRHSIAIDELDLARMLSLQAQLYNRRFEVNQDVNLLVRSISLHTKIDTLLSRQLLSLQFQKSQLNLLDQIQEYYGDAIQDALKLYRHSGKQEYLHLAYFFSSKTKAIILQNELNKADAFKSIASPDMIEKEKMLVQQMFDLQALLTKNGDEQETILRQYAEAQRELDLFLLEIEKTEPTYYQNKYAFITPPDREMIQESLPQNLAVVEFFYRPDTIYSFWITQDRFLQVPIANDERLKQALSDFTDQCRDPGKLLSSELGYLLYQQLMSRGLMGLDRQVERLCIIPDGILHTLPFETLNQIQSDGAYSFLIEQYSVAYTYSINFLFQKTENTFGRTYLGFGTPYSSDLSQKLKNRRRLFGEENLSQLTLAKEEINRANSIFSGNIFLDQEATLDNFYQYSADARIIHLSLHGLVDFEDPLRSSILFDDQEDDFILSAADLYSHSIHADLVVLSACHSADGKIYIGEGVQGMSKAFMLSGAQSVLSSLWSASEASSLEIMTRFFQNFQKGTPKDLALHRAKLEYLQSARPSQRHPFYWANFIMIGELDVANSSILWNSKILIPALLLMIGLFFYGKKKLLISKPGKNKKN